MSDELRPFLPDWTLSPGFMIRESMRTLCISEAELADGAQLRPETVAGVLAATVPVDDAIAEGISRVLGTSSQMWRNAERIYREDLARGAKDCSSDYKELPSWSAFPDGSQREQPR